LLIKQSQVVAARSVNTVLINLYLQVGEYISRQVAGCTWGDKTIEELAEFISKQFPALKGFNRQGLYRMKKFYETYSQSSIVSQAVIQLQHHENQSLVIVLPVVTQFKLSDIRKTLRAKLTRTNHRLLLSRTKTEED